MITFSARLLPLALLVVTLCTCDRAQTVTPETTDSPDRGSSLRLAPAAIKPVTVFAYEDILWGFRFLPDGRMIATDKAGKFLLIDAEAGAKEITQGVPTVKNIGQGGLLDVLPSPTFAEDRMLYFSFSEPAAGQDPADKNTPASTSVARGTLNAAETALENVEILYAAAPKTDKPYHFGSRLVWGPEDGHLYFTIGDRGERDVNPQDSTRDGGKVYRIAADGSIPADNPFVDYAGARQAIYSYGHRNPQSLTVHPVTGEIWETEHGPRGGDEINLIQPGLNYGWPTITYGINYNGSQITEEVAAPGLEQPLHYWVPSIAPSGMAFVTGDRYPGWEGDLMVGSLKFSRLQHVDLEDGKVVGEQKLIENLGRVRDVRMGPDGYLYASVEVEGIVRLEVE